MDKRIVSTLIPAVILIFTGNPVHGMDKIITESREVSNFNRVSLSASGELTITQGNEESLTVEADENIMPYVKTEVEYGTLFLGMKRGSWFKSMQHHTPIKYHLTLKNLNALDLSGSGNIKASHIETDQLDIHISGSGNATIESLITQELVVRLSGSGDCRLSGDVEFQKIKISGSGEYYAPELDSKTVDVKISGSGKVTLWARDKLNVKISGSGKVNYYGDPKVTQTITGSGGIKNLGRHKR